VARTDGWSIVLIRVIIKYFVAESLENHWICYIRVILEQPNINGDQNEIIEELNSEQISWFKYDPITRCDVSDLRYKTNSKSISKLF